MALIREIAAEIILRASRRRELPVLLNLHTLSSCRVLSESEFNALVDETFAALEQALDAIDDDLDYETSGGVLTVAFANDTRLVFSRQPPTRQLWLAARSGGFHFAYDENEGDWRNTRDGQLFRPFVVQQMRVQGAIDFAWV
jgi:CyaY protein